MPAGHALPGPGRRHRPLPAPENAPQGPAQRPAKGLLAGLWQPVLWEDTALTAAETAARLAALGLDCTGGHFTPLPAAKHIFTHIEWHQSGYFLTVPEQPAPAGCVWAGKEQLEAAYTLPGAFKAYKKLLLTKLL